VCAPNSSRDLGRLRRTSNSTVQEDVGELQGARDDAPAVQSHDVEEAIRNATRNAIRRAIRKATRTVIESIVTCFVRSALPKHIGDSSSCHPSEFSV